MSDKKISLIFPYQEKPGDLSNTRAGEPAYRALGHDTIHNLGLDTIINELTPIEAERTYCLRVMSNLTDDPRVAVYRADVFEDILNSPDLRENMIRILDKINFLRDYGGFKRDHDDSVSASAWELMHRLEDIRDYIACVEAIHDCLTDAQVKSEGLNALKEHVDAIYTDNAFAELKEDISKLKASTTDIKSVTLGVNLNDRFEAESIGVVSINNKRFTKSNLIGGFNDAITASKGGIKDGNEWDENYKYQPFNATRADMIATVDRLGRMKAATSGMLGALTVASIPVADSTTDVTRYMDRVVNHMMYLTVRKLKSVLSKYVSITITDITDLIPEFMYYIRWSEYVERMQDAGYLFRKPHALCNPSRKDVLQNGRADADPAESGRDRAYMEAHGVYNPLLALAHLQDKLDIVRNDLIFDEEHCTYILTGANRGGKTTITVAVGLLFVFAQGGIYVPGTTFKYVPVDCIFTHFPADEDRTMDLGRLGEECKRFKEIYGEATCNSLLLLNETFSTTSFEEGYFIARDALKAVLSKGARTIYNTHMHKLARDLEEINAEAEGCGMLGVKAKAQSLIVRSDGGSRSFKIAVAPPEGTSYAEDIARKYGVTYEMLTEE